MKGHPSSRSLCRSATLDWERVAITGVGGGAVLWDVADYQRLSVGHLWFIPSRVLGDPLGITVERSYTAANITSLQIPPWNHPGGILPGNPPGEPPGLPPTRGSPTDPRKVSGGTPEVPTPPLLRLPAAPPRSVWVLTIFGAPHAVMMSYPWATIKNFYIIKHQQKTSRTLAENVIIEDVCVPPKVTLMKSHDPIRTNP